MTKLGGRCIVQKSRRSSNLGVIAHRRGTQLAKTWRFAESRRITQNVNKAMRTGETSHQAQRAHSICLLLRRCENQRRLSGFQRYGRMREFELSRSMILNTCAATVNGATSQERLKIEVKLLLSANRKSYMPRRLAQQRMTLSDLEWSSTLKSTSSTSHAISKVGLAELLVISF